MATPVVGRVSELEAIERLLDALDEGPAALILEGEAGIGKTTLLLAAADLARMRGFQVLSCTGSPADARLAHAALADMLRDVGDEEIELLPGPQREALDAARLRIQPESATIDPLAICTASLAVFESVASKCPVLVVIDDLPWLDQPTARVVSFCSRRITGPIAVIASQRTGDGDPERPLIKLREPDRTEMLEVGALEGPALGEMLRDRAPDPLSRQAVSRIGEASGGNPFYALELSRGLDPDAAPSAALPLPASLEEVVTAKVTGLADEVEETLLASAALANPTLGVVAQAFRANQIKALEASKEEELVILDRERVRFAHPLLAHGIYARAAAPRRREMHRRLSAVLTDPEERARHLAHARVLPDAIE